MTITIQAIATNSKHSASILSRLASAGFPRSLVQLAPAGMDRLVRTTSRFPRARQMQALHNSITNATVAVATVIMACIGGVIGTVIGVMMVQEDTHIRLATIQVPLIVVGSLSIGAGLGAVLGMLAGLLFGTFRRIYPRIHENSEGPVMLALETDNLDSAITAETILHHSGAQEIHVRGLNG